MNRGATSGKNECGTLLLLMLAAAPLHADPRCAGCHAKEVEGYMKSGMARSLAPIGTRSAPPDGGFEHGPSKTSFFVRSTSSTMMQGFTRRDESTQHAVTFVIGSGDHAFGYLIQVEDDLFQSPLSYYTNRKIWDVAPGYQLDAHPDFSRPVTPECLTCHSGKPLPVPDGLNRYRPGVFAAYGISCERCHGDCEAHLKNPARGLILNPAKMSGAARASVCEECHLTGEARIPNPGKSLLDFRPGQTLEDVYTTYVAAEGSGQNIKVVSHAEQLALSRCALKSGGRLWCGTCHDPHEKPAQPAAYFRERCLSCHAATLEKAHAAAGRDCIACHMRQLPAKDGGHTAFTDHRIALPSKAESPVTPPGTITAWREPDRSFRERNLALALVAVGLQNESSAEVIRGYKMLNRLESDFPNDPAVLTSLGVVLLKGKQPAEALKRFEKVVELQPGYAPYHWNLARALLGTNHAPEAAGELEKALALDALFQPAVELLSEVYRGQGQIEKGNDLMRKYEQAVGISRH
jgi:hypothetical protein